MPVRGTGAVGDPVTEESYYSKFRRTFWDRLNAGEKTRVVLVLVGIGMCFIAIGLMLGSPGVLLASGASIVYLCRL